MRECAKYRLEQREADRAQAGEAWGLIFTSRYGSAIDPRNFNRSFTLRCRKADVPVITVHDARRTCGVSSAQAREALRRLGDSLNNDQEDQ